MKKLLVFALTVAMISCSKEDKNPNVTSGDQISVFGGKVWTTLQSTPKGEPRELSLVFTDNVFNTVPSPEHSGGIHENTFVIPVAQKAIGATGVKFVMLNWNPEGHEPPGIYDVPHFDMHFYFAEAAQVMNFTDAQKLEIDPAPGFIPANHFGGAPVPMMGKHWIDMNAPELNGHPFTETFLFGSYDGKVVFYEPMITLQFLKETHQYQRTIPQPQKFATAGYYPTKMQIKKRAGTTEVVLTDFVSRQAAE